MVKILVIFSLIFIVFISCNSNHPTTKENEAITKPTLLGIWKVDSINETDFAIEDGDTLKGPFINTPKNEAIEFKTDSIIYYGSSEDGSIISRYTYKKINDTLLNVVNINYGNSMKFYIHHLDISKLLFTNIRFDERRGNRYEVTIDCRKN